MDENEKVDPSLKASGANKFLRPYKSRKSIIFDNFLGGIFWSLGTSIGFAIILVVAGYLISRIDLVPIIGHWLSQILEDATSRIQPQLIK